MPVAHWKKLFPHLVVDDPNSSWSKYSSRDVSVVCKKCGDTKTIKFKDIRPSAKCNKCITANAGDMVGKRFGSLTVLQNCVTSDKVSYTYIRCQCSCGRVKDVPYTHLINSKTTTCGKCKVKPASWWHDRWFGRLTLLHPEEEMYEKSTRRFVFRCKCGNDTKPLKVFHVTTGNTKSCGLCYVTLSKFWDNKPVLVSKMPGYTAGERYPLEQLLEYFKGAYMQPLEGANNVVTPIKWRCGCGKISKRPITCVTASHGVSCGCINGVISKANTDIAEFCKTLTPDVELEFKVGKHRYGRWSFDVRADKLLIEHHGLTWHADKIDNVKKRQAAHEAGYTVLVVYSDEWKDRKAVFKRIIANKLGKSTPLVSIRPNQCELVNVSKDAATEFYEQNHYQGSCIAKHHIGARYNGEIVAILSIRRPARQNSGDWEIARMASCNGVRVYGVWSWLLKRAIDTLNLSGILVTYSDNRLYGGNVYAAMGMTSTSKVDPDYYWVRKEKRFHKSGLRKTAEERASGKTETELREAQGYYKVWDLGKQKWETVLPSTGSATIGGLVADDLAVG
jgi:hypothetical protein